MVGYKKTRRSKSKSRSRRPLAKGSSARARAKVVKGYTRKTGLYGRFGPVANKPEAKFMDCMTMDNADGSRVALAPVLTKVYWGAIVPFDMTSMKREFPPGPVEHLLQVAQGTQVSERVGRKFYLRTMQVHLTCSLHSPSAQGAVRMHFYLVQDTQYNGGTAAPPASDIWQATYRTDAPAGFVVGPWFDSYPNLANTGRFRILKHKKIDLTAAIADSSANNGERLQEVTFSVAPKIPIEFAAGDTTGVLSNLRTNGIFPYYAVEWANPLSNDAVGAGSVNLMLRTRIRFTDL